jgi:hypothetical protein
MRLFQTENVWNVWRKTHILCSIYFFFENSAVCEIKWKNNVEQSRPHVTLSRMHIACWTTKTAHSLAICNSYCFSTATRTRLNVRFYVHCLSGIPFVTSVVSCLLRIWKSSVTWMLETANPCSLHWLCSEVVLEEWHELDVGKPTFLYFPRKAHNITFTYKLRLKHRPFPVSKCRGDVPHAMLHVRNVKCKNVRAHCFPYLFLF